MFHIISVLLGKKIFKFILKKTFHQVFTKLRTCAPDSCAIPVDIESRQRIRASFGTFRERGSGPANGSQQ